MFESLIDAVKPHSLVQISHALHEIGGEYVSPAPKEGAVRLISLVAPGAGLRQGDVLNVIDQAHAPYHAQLAVVITADCDLVQDKHYGHVLLCPIIPASSYYEEIWCRKRLTSFREKILTRLRAELGELSRRGVLKSSLSDQAFGIISSSEVALRSALSSLGLSSGNVDELARQVASLELSRSVSGNLLALTSGSAHNQRKDTSSIREKLFSDFKADLGKDAIDIVVTNDDISGDDVVHVVLLRAPFSVPAHHICLGIRENEDVQLRRVGRFAPEIKFLIAQKFGTLFSRVGMKSEIERERDAAIELLEDLP